MQRIRIASLLLLAGGLFYLAAWTSIEFTRGNGRIAAVWLPNALAIAFLLRFKSRRELKLLAAMWIGNVLANLTVGDTLAKALGLSLSNSAEIVIAIWMVRKLCGPQPDMKRLSDILQLCFAAGVAPAISATIATVVLHPAASGALAIWGKWALTDALGIILLTPATLIFIDAARNPRRPGLGEAAEWSFHIAIGIGAALLVFGQTSLPLLFLIAPVMVMQAFRMGSFGTALSMVVIATIATIFTALGRGPVNLAAVPDDAQLIVLKMFLASCFIMSLPVAAAWQDARRLVHEVRRQTRHLSLLADNMADAVLVYRVDGTCTYASPSVKDVLGASSEELVGSNATIRSHPESRDAIVDVHIKLTSGLSESERFTYRRLLDDDAGKPVYIEAFCRLVRHKETGLPYSVIASARDVTERVVLERKLIDAREKAEEAATAKSRFLANMSHEIRTPMNGVLGFAELLLQDELAPEQQRKTELIVESGRSMMRLLNDILDVSKIEAGKISVIKEPLRIRHMVDSCLKLHQANAQSNGLQLAAEVSDDLPEAIATDPQRVRQILLNLVGNAVKFTPEGEVAIRARKDGEHIAIVVSDTGVGIPPDRLETIFQPFEQADDATSRRFGGTGLGLTICRQLATLLGGSLTASSTESQGSRFELRLPLVEVDSAGLPVQGSASTDQQLIMPPRARILLAEDIDINRMLVSTMLDSCNQSAETAVDGLDAVTKVIEARDKGKPFDLVLMDVQMPRCDGYTATRDIRSAGISAEQLPIIALTANAFPEDVQAAEDAGMQGHIPKPLRMRDLVEALCQWLPCDEAPESKARKIVAVVGGGNENPDQMAKPDLHKRWLVRRQEALDAIAKLLREGELEDAELADIAREVHKLAGTAGMFGEDQLGKLAAKLEHALGDAGSNADIPETAKELLAAA